jgi:hypothetical protein
MLSGTARGPASATHLAVPELRRDGDLAPIRSERFTRELFVDEGTVHFGGIEERDAALGRLPNQRDHGAALGSDPTIVV